MKIQTTLTVLKLGRISKISAFALAASMAMFTPGTRAANIEWQGGTADYTNVADWVGGAVPGASDSAINDNGTNNMVQINIGDPNWIVNQIRAGNGVGNGAFVQNGQNVTLTGTNLNGSVVSVYTTPFRLGVVAGDTGIYALNGGAINYGSGGLDVGELGTGILNINGGTISGSGNFADNLGTLATPAAVTATVGGDLTEGDYTWFEQGYYTPNPSVGLPAAGTTITSISQADHSYVMPPSYTANDAVMVSSNVASATITPTALGACSGLSFLGSAGNGPAVVNYTVHHADSTTETGSLSIPDWFGPSSAPEVFSAAARVDALGLTVQLPANVAPFSGNAPYLWSFDIALTDTSSAVTSIGLTYVSGGTACILGVSSSTGGGYTPVNMTGYNEDMIVEAGAQSYVSGSVTDVVNQTNGAVSVTGGGQLFVGNAGAGIYNLSGGSVDVQNYIALGRSSGNGTLNMTGGTFNQDGGGNLLVGTGFNNNGNPAVGVLNQSAGTINCQGQFLCPETSPSTGTYNLSGTGALIVNNWLVFGRSGGVGVLNMTGGSILQTNSGGNFEVGETTPGTVNQSGGSVATYSQLWIGQAGGAVGVYNLSGTGALTVYNWLAVGRNGGTGTLNLTNGTVAQIGNSGNHFDVGAGGTGTLNQFGGLVTNTTGDFWLGETAGGTWNFNGGTAVLGNVVMCVQNSASAQLNLNGGLFQASGIASPTTGSTVSILSLNGATLQANGNNSTFISGLYQASVGSAGVIIDSQGYNITVPQTLTDNGGGTLTKIGSGTLTLTGANNYAGNTIINAGTLITGTGSSASANYAVADNAGFGVTVQSAGAEFTAANVTLGSSLGASLNFDLGSFGNPLPGQAPLNVGTTFTVKGTITVNVTDVLPQLGESHWSQYQPGGLAGGGNFVIGSLPVGVTAALLTNAVNNSIDLNITGVNQPRWDGEAGGNWDINGTTNWVNIGTGLATFYTDGSPVLFNDSALGTTNVNLVTTVSPHSITVTNNALNYTFVGTGKIAGSTSLVKQGSGSLAILNTGGNSYTGPTVISGGTLTVTNLANGGSPSAIGASSANPTNLVLAGATLSYQGPTVNINRGYSMTASSVINVQGGANLILGGLAQASGSTTTLSKTGAGTQTYAGVGTNVLSTGDANPGYQIQAGTVIFDGSAGTQTNRENGQMFVGSTPNSGASLILTNTSLGCSDWFAAGRGTGNSGYLSTVSLYNSALTCPQLSVGYANGLPNLASQVINLTNSQLIVTGSGAANIAESSGSSAILNLNGNSLFSVGAGTGTLNIGSANAGPSAVVNVMGNSTINANLGVLLGGGGGQGVLNLNSTNASFISTNNGPFRVGGNAGGSDIGVGAINQTAGNFTSGVSSGDYLALGIGSATSYGSYNLSGGTLNRPGTGIRVGRGGLASFVQSGGTFNCGGEFSLSSSGGFGNGVAEAAFTGGTTLVNSANGFRVPEASAFTAAVDIGTEAGGNASVVTLFSSGFQLCYGGAAGSGTLNLDSGTLQLGGPISKVAGSGTGVANFNGGTVQAGANSITLIDTTPSSANVFKGGLTVDTMGNNATVSGNLLTTFGNGIYPAGGTLLVPNNGGAGYIGAPLVTVSGGSGSGAKAIATVSDGIVTNVIITCPGQNYQAGDVLTFTFAGGGSATTAGNFVAAGNFVYTLQAGDLAANSGGGLTKVGNGTLYLTGGSTYLGTTLVNAGILAGTASVNGPLTVASGATLAVGSSPTSIGTFTVNSTLTLSAGSTNFMKINQTASTKDFLTGISQVNYGGTLTVSNQSGTLAAGNSFKLYSATTYSGAFNATNLPALGSGLSWIWNPANGTLSVSSGVNTNPTNITFSVSGGNLNLSWPGDHLGWRLLAQTNSLAKGLGTNWVTWPNSTSVTNVSVPITATNPAVFFRLVYP